MGAPELVHTATMRATLAAETFMVPGGPKGTRLIAEVADAVVEGERLRAKMVGVAAGDWLTLSPDGSYGSLDVRLTLRTDDDVIVFCSYLGRIDLVAGRVISTPLFECGDERYDWLNRAQFIADGTLDQEAGTIAYELYEVRPT